MSKKYPVKPPVSIGQVYTETCNHCHGSGQEPGLPDLTCRECAGRGSRRWRILECQDCRGRGKKSILSLTRCKTCRGRGWTRGDVSL